MEISIENTNVDPKQNYKQTWNEIKIEIKYNVNENKSNDVDKSKYGINKYHKEHQITWIANINKSNEIQRIFRIYIIQQNKNKIK